MHPNRRSVSCSLTLIREFLVVCTSFASIQMMPEKSPKIVGVITVFFLHDEFVNPPIIPSLRDTAFLKCHLPADNGLAC